MSVVLVFSKKVMVVVAIIGILASIAIPNFQRFRRQSMRVEPKTVMSGLYSSQIVFSSEWNGLTADFSQLGFDIGNQESTRYMTGWANGSDVPDPSSDTWYHGPPALATGILHISPNQCIDQRKCNNRALKKAFSNGAYTFRASSRTNCTYCDNSGQLKKANNKSCRARGSVCIQLWNDGKLRKRENLLQFVIGSAGDIGSGQADIWHMNFNKKLTLVQDGVD